ncbi:anti-sigma factor [Streptomyces sp. LBUM 1478]|uniref:anti-sigma factor n=1 Tax=Streptomyces scabiei TaxID=1930 RepID=UPI000765D61A|nr:MULTISPECIES: anti-sigma factor [Streptomyces]MBP5859837.1 anti-sigma factor [Streptomyces sp. LBUM 1484]MBP5871460.1 anti-sigma factor [Streptomyces sp. LBUM 1485]MBP5909695.1 anti-sigma factor [Streptomyces sp. LBUM 1478]MBP5927234.1 anti-sigma factor [Streptomyces sp. LBUM 1479]MBP5879902.1 anti-sigma factor [Streptomyces sp. LBUM 1477]
MTTTELHRLTGAYALHALSDEEHEAFERHLADCQPCAQETAELCATAARLGLAVSTTSPPVMRERVLRRIATVRQEAPGGSTPSRSGGARPRTRLLSRWALAACLAAAAALGGTTVWQYQRAEEAVDQARRAERGADEIAAVLAAPDARSRSSELTAGASGTVVVSRNLDRAVFVASGLARPSADKVYQLWFDDDGTMRSAGLMDPRRRDQTVLMRGALDGASGMGVTLEPAGGSKQPTSAPLAVMPFPG